jgi:hypothetical protein
MSRSRRCAELRCNEPVVGQVRRCPKHQAERDARANENLRRGRLAADMLHDDRLPDGDAERVAAVAGEFAAVSKVWVRCLALRSPIDDLPNKAMEPLGIAQNDFVQRCVWRAARLREYVVEGAVPPGADETAQLAQELAELTARVKQATRDDRQRRGWPT